MRINIFGVLVSKTNLNETIKVLLNHDYKQANYICLPDLSVIIAAQRDKTLMHILNHSFLTLPDGKPIEFISKLKGEKKVSTVSGYWLIRELLNSDLKHYFYGGSPDSVIQMVNNLKSEFPNSKIVGFSSPPFLKIKEIENNSSLRRDIEEINQSEPDIVWVGISSPKQDYLNFFYHKMLTHGVMVGVGGVFDYLEGSKRKSPEWIKKIGLRWLYRLIQEPKRLWKKYLFTIIGLLLLFVLKIRDYFKRIFKNRYTF